MSLNSIKELVEVLKKHGEELYPITDVELKRIEALNKKALPIVYKEFLLYMGKNAGNFMKGSSAFYDEIFELHEWGNELLNENGLEALPDNSFVFWMHQGYQMAYFVLGESDNPNVHYFSEGKGLKNFIEKDSLLKFFEEQLGMSGLKV